MRPAGLAAVRGEAADPLVFLIAGEPSGDLIGARLMAALRRRTDGRIRFAGVGGAAMTAEGLDSLFDMGDLAVMGFVEVLPRARFLLRRVREAADAVARLGPGVVVSIDSPGFTYRVARLLRGRGSAVPRVHYVAPQVWAWRSAKAKKTARLFDRLLVLLPFEPPYFEREGLATTYVGHPAVEAKGRVGDGAAFRERHAIPPDARVVGLLPGSRRGEVGRLLPVFARAVERARRSAPDLHAVLPTVPTVAAQVAAEASAWPAPATVVPTMERLDAFAACDAALAASGTVTLELAMAGVPFATAYRVNPLTATLVRRMLRVKYVTLANVVLDRPAVPEFLQERCTSENLGRVLADLLTDDAARGAQRAAFAEVAERLSSDGPSPSDRAAEVVLEVLGAPAAKARA